MRTALSFEEVLPRPEPAPAPATLAERLRLCSRLLAVAADELEAQGRGDPAKRTELATTREELIREIHSPAATDDSESDDRRAETDEILLLLPQEVAKTLAEVLYELEEREEEERRMQDRWSSLEEDALKAIHVGGKVISLRAGSYPDRPRSSASLDVRF